MGDFRTFIVLALELALFFVVMFGLPWLISLIGRKRG